MMPGEQQRLIQSRNNNNPTRASASMSFEAGLDRNTTSPFDNWVRQSDIATRLVNFGDCPLPGLVSHMSAPGRPATVMSVASSMALGPLVHNSNASAQAPSLCFSGLTDPETIQTETSISTGLVNQLAGVLLLEENNGVLEMPHAPRRTPVYECTFWFLHCGEIFSDKEAWEMHCLSHFRGEEPPRSVQCPLCDWAFTHEDEGHAWDMRMQHLACFHVMFGQTLRTSRPDFHLFQHLWQKRLIDDQDLKELKGRNHNLTSQPGNFVETNGRRRERNGRVHRAQHVAPR